jgi:hypothetical protein
VVHAYNSSTWETGAGGSLVQGQPMLHSKILSKKLRAELITVAHACNPSYLGDGARRSTVQDQPGQKVSEILSQRTNQV